MTDGNSLTELFGKEIIEFTTAKNGGFFFK